MLGIYWLYDARDLMAEAFIDLATDDPMTAFNIGLGAYYPFARQNITPMCAKSRHTPWRSR